MKRHPPTADSHECDPSPALPGHVRLSIEYWTDPLCCWSWAFEPQWRRLRYELGDALVWRYRMGGMIPAWSNYSDPLNSINRPMQMGPLWFQVRHVSGMPIDDKLWVEDPPASSYLSCIAVKAAERQSSRAGELYLRRLREAVMVNRRNISRRAVLLDVADELSADRPDDFDASTLARDLDARPAIDAFREDLKQASFRNIGRFPTLTLRRPGQGGGIILVGYRPYAALIEAIGKVVGTLCSGDHQSRFGTRPPQELWESLLPREQEELAQSQPSPLAPTTPRSA